MKQNLAWGLVVALVFAGALWLGASKPVVVTAPVVTAPVAAAENAATVVVKPSESFKSARTKLSDSSVKDLSPSCKKLWSEIRDIDFTKVSHDEELRLEVLVSSDCSGVPEVIGEAHKRFFEYCREYSAMLMSRGPVVKESRESCLVAMGVYRAQMTDIAFQNVNVAEISDPRIIADVAVSRYTYDAKKAAEASKKLWELNPDSYPTAKMYVMSEFASFHEAGSWTPDKQDELRKIMERVERVKGADKEFLHKMDFSLTAVVGAKPDELLVKAKEYQKQHPNSGLGDYMAACAEQKKENRAAVIRHLKTAIQKSPENADYKAALERYEKAAPGVKLGFCSLNMEIPTELYAPNL